MHAYLLEFILAGFAILMLLAEAFVIPRGAKSLLALGGVGILGLILILMNFAVDSTLPTPDWLKRFYIHDSQALIFKNIALLSTILVQLLAWDFKAVLNKFTSEKGDDSHTGEFYSLPLFACAGMMWMVSSIDLVSIFVSLELVTICFYVMVAYMRRNVGSLEAGVKYLILGALSTGILVYGIAWLYGATGTTQLGYITQNLDVFDISTPTLFALSLIIIALAFKVGAVPMQLWIPDVYQGAPTPITAFLSVASKAAGFAIAIRILMPFIHFEQVQNILLVLAGATLVYGNLAALKQTNFKRLLAYSSIAHAGFILIALAAGKFDLVAFYLMTYLIMTFAAFFLQNQVSVNQGSDELEVFDGLGKRNPRIATFFTIIMAAMAGLPLTVGFYGKFFVIRGLFESELANIAILLTIILSVPAGFYYYFKLIKAMYWHEPKSDEEYHFSFLSRCVVLVLVCAIVFFGFLPKSLIEVVTF